MSFFSATGPPPGRLYPTLESYIRDGGQARQNGKLNWPSTYPLNPATSQTHPNFNSTVIGQPWFQQKYLQRKQKALNTSPAFDIFNGETIPLERGSRFRDIAEGTLGHTHTGPYLSNGSIMHHKYNRKTSRTSVALPGIRIHTTR
jgi:hypothetical protein